MSTVNPELPQPKGVDKLIGVIRCIVTGIPVVGGSVTEAWSAFFSSPLVSRREAWLGQLAMAVAELQVTRPGLTLDALQSDERFVTAVLTATSVAIRTHQQEKLDALRNAALSGVLHKDIEEDQQAMFMKYVDDFSPWHLRVASAFHDPDSHFLAKHGQPWFDRDKNNQLWSPTRQTFEFMRRAFPELVSDAQFMDQIAEDLGMRSIICVKGMFQQTLPDVGPYTTITGAKFMRFIGRT